MKIFCIPILNSFSILFPGCWIGCTKKQQSLNFGHLSCMGLDIYLKSHQQKFGEFSGLFEERPSIFRNTKEIPKNTKENWSWFCICHTFLTISAINLIPWQVICICPTLSIDTQLGHNHGHLWSSHNSHYGHNGRYGCSAIWPDGHNYGKVGCPLKDLWK